MPQHSATLGHMGTMRFIDALIAHDWPLAEQVFAEEDDIATRGHMISASTQMGGRPDRLSPWVDAAPDPALALLARGAMGVAWAWDARSSAYAARVSEDMAREFQNRLYFCEDDLRAACNAAPTSTLPWHHLLASARGLQLSRHEIDERYRGHMERGALMSGHLQYQQSLCAKWYGSHEEMWQFAEDVCAGEPVGSPALAVVPMAFVEHWCSVRSDYDTPQAFLHDSGKRALLLEAAHKCYGNPSFPAHRPDGAVALSIFFAQFYAINEISAAQTVAGMIGDRFSDYAMMRLSRDSWPKLRKRIGCI